jgi:hypothetical protein
MGFTVRVPLISPIEAVIYRLDIQATWKEDPPGTQEDTGYDYLFREPVVSRTSGVRTVTRVEMSPVRVPAQVETLSYQQLQATFGGDNPATDMAFVLHRKHLEELGLLDTDGNCVFKPGDRIDSIEKNGRTVNTFKKQLFVYEVRPRSWGFGPDGYDLEIVYTTHRSADPRRP